MSYRKFYMTNGNGDTFTFTEESSKVFLNDPSGLGFSNTVSTNQYVNALTVVTSEQQFGTIGGEVLFYADYLKDIYSAYNSFVDFLTYTPLTFYYTIPTEPAQTFHCDVAVASVDKTEVKEDGMLRSAFNLLMLSRWKGEEVVVSGINNLFVTNTGHFPVGFEITITNSTLNPVITLTDPIVETTVYGQAKFEDDTAFDTVYINSNDGEQNVELTQGGAILPNPLSYQDLSISNGSIYVTFMKIPRGKYKLKLSSEALANPRGTVKFTPIYRSV